MSLKTILLIHDKIHAQIQENKLKEPKKQSKFQQRLQEVMEQQEAAKKQNKKNKLFIKKISICRDFFIFKHTLLK